jgi:protein-disulfide isomerase
MAVCAAALVASAILLVDYVRPAPVFCAAEGGCGVVRRSAFAYPLGVPTPLLGLGGFLAIGLAQLLPGRRARLAQVALAGVGGAVAAAFIAIQIGLKTICPYCAVADVAALLLLGLSVLRLSRGSDPPEQKAHLAAAVLAVVVAVGAPIGVGMSRKAIPASVPAVIAEEMQKTARGKITVVDFVDFECPFCRLTHAELGPLLAARKDKVRVARKHVPLRMHAHAMDAARTACCAERAGKGDEMAEALFSADPATITPEGCEALALAHGLDVPRFRECMKDPATEARILADTAAFRAAHGQGLPTLYIDGTVLEGAQDHEVLAATLDSAIKGL